MPLLDPLAVTISISHSHSINGWLSEVSVERRMTARQLEISFVSDKTTGALIGDEGDEGRNTICVTSEGGVEKNRLSAAFRCGSELIAAKSRAIPMTAAINSNTFGGNSGFVPFALVAIPPKSPVDQT